MPIGGNDPVCGEILDALGLKNVVKFELKIEVGKLASIRVEYYPEGEDIQKMIPVLEEYRLVNKHEDG